MATTRIEPAATYEDTIRAASSLVRAEAARMAFVLGSIVSVRHDLHDGDVEDEGGVGRDVPCTLFAVGIFGGDADLHAVPGAHPRQRHLEPHDEVADHEAGGERLSLRGVKDLAVDETTRVVAIDDVRGTGKTAIRCSRHNGTAFYPAEHRAALQDGDTLLLRLEFQEVAVGIAVEILVFLGFHIMKRIYCS